jgi:hypothetical protein
MPLGDVLFDLHLKKNLLLASCMADLHYMAEFDAHNFIFNN